MTSLLPAPGRSIDRPTVPAAPARDRRLVRTGPVSARDASSVPQTRSRRDPFVDGVRALGILLVIALHWVMVEATWDGRQLVVGNALSHGAAWLLTWLQPLPLLFFAAGAAARYDLARHPDLSGWRFAGTWVLRMAVPVGVFAAVWAVLVVVLPWLGIPRAAVDRAVGIVPQPLWFLAVQVALLALTPVLLRLLRRWGGARVLVVAALLPLVVDLLRFSGGMHLAGALNVLLVWAVPYLAGLLYATRRSTASVPLRPGAVPERTVLILLGGAGLAATVLLLAAGPYPVSLIGMPGDAISNLAPPTAPVVGFCVAQIAAALLVRDAISAWAGRSALVRWVSAQSMRLYLWHLTAMFAVVGLVLIGAGRALPEPWTWDWWATRAQYGAAAAATLAVFVVLARRAEGALPLRRSATTTPPNSGNAPRSTTS